MLIKGKGILRHGIFIFFMGIDKNIPVILICMAGIKMAEFIGQV